MLVRVAVAVSFALLAAPCHAQRPDAAPTRAAVVVAADEYRNLPGEDLPTAKSAIERLRAALQAHGGFTADSVTSLSGAKVNEGDVHAAILAAGNKIQAGDDALLLVAWAGLGASRPAGDSGEQVVLTATSKPQEFGFSDEISVPQLAGWMNDARAEAARRGVALQPVLILDPSRPGRMPAPPPLAAPALPVWVAYAARDGQTVAAQPGSDGFAFTMALADTLAQVGGRGTVASLEAVFLAARDATQRRSGGTQDPALVPCDPALQRAAAPMLVVASGKAKAAAGGETPAGWACEVLDPTPGAGGYARKVKDKATGIVFLLVEPGAFQMGSAKGDSDEQPVHTVKLTKPFYLAATETTQAQWATQLPAVENGFVGPTLPVDSAEWDDAWRFLRKLNGGGDGPFRLPTEAEWEYACRAGTSSEYAFGDVISTAQANYDGERTWGGSKPGLNRERTVEAGSLPANAWGFHEMHGNVWEWCQDWFEAGSGSYEARRNGVTDPQGPTSGSAHPVRGGSWCSNPVYLRSSYRLDTSFQINRIYTGFRVARSV